jgi:3-(3-hydroxy-phenyl)propionate hydroxylase
VVGDPRQILDPDRLEFLDLIGAHLFTLDPSIPGALRDVDEALSAWLVEHGLEAVISRPDFYAFGGVPHLSQLPELIDDLRQQLLLTTIVA